MYLKRRRKTSEVGNFYKTVVEIYGPSLGSPISARNPLDPHDICIAPSPSGRRYPRMNGTGRKWNKLSCHKRKLNFIYTCAFEVLDQVPELALICLHLQFSCSKKIMLKPKRISEATTIRSITNQCWSFVNWLKTFCNMAHLVCFF